jgi:hypothetical protein
MLSSPVLVGQTPAQRQVTFAKDIGPILQRTCQNCHRPNGGLAPMPLTTYEEVRPWAAAVKLRTSKREMPPWFIEKNVGIQKFKDDVSLSDEEIATIATWVNSGAPRGNPADMPPPRQFVDSNVWSIGEPDVIVNSPLMTVKAEGGDFHTPYIGSSPTGLIEDRWVAAFEVKEFRPGETWRTPGRPGGEAGLGINYFVLHHQAISTTPPGETESGEPADTAERPGVFYYMYEPGQNAQFTPEGVGIKLKAGEPIYFNSTHLHSIGKEVQLMTQIGFKLHPRWYTPKYPQGYQLLRATSTDSTTATIIERDGRRRRQVISLGAELDIPGNTDNVRFDRFYPLNKPAKLVNFEPHLHASGKRMCVEAIYPTGIVETLNCAGYNHAWVKNYQYQDDVAPLLPKGTILHAIAWYDNTAKNPRVADPRNWRGLGQRSIDDMIIFLGKIVSYSDEEFAAEVAARAKQQMNKITSTAHQRQ